MNQQRLAAELKRKSEIASDDYGLLSSQGAVGFYKECEVTQIFLLNKTSSEISNYFSVINFEEHTRSEMERFITKGLQSINDTYQLGIIQRRITIEAAKRLFEGIQKGDFQLAGERCSIANNLVLLAKQFISQYYENGQPLINKIIKPNYWGDNYIIEFFDEDKSILENLSRGEIDKINGITRSCEEIKIDLSKMYDRIGNIIFQFPITLFLFDHELKDDRNSIEVTYRKHPLLSKPRELLLTTKTTRDDVLTGYNSSIISTADNNPILLELGDDYNAETTVCSLNPAIIYHRSKWNFVRNFMFSVGLIEPNAKPRTIVDRYGKTRKINIDAYMRRREITRKVKRGYRDHIRRREQEEEIIRHSGDYKVFNGNQVEVALCFLREKINSLSHKSKEICLWDPYLSVQDIIDTLYFEATGMPFRCITSDRGLGGVNNDDSKNVYEPHIKRFHSKSDNLHIKLEFRCQHSIHGYSFHDRFLISVPLDEFALPTVYSLGTSINGIGKQYHIIQKVPNPRMILGHFNKLWDELSAEDCLILKLPK